MVLMGKTPDGEWVKKGRDEVQNATVSEKTIKYAVHIDGPLTRRCRRHDFVNDPDGQPIKSAADGTVTVKVRNQGLNVVTAIFDGPADDPSKIDKIEHLATLSFVLPHAPE